MIDPSMAERAQTSVYLTQEDREMIAELMRLNPGLNRSTIFRLGLHKLYENVGDRQTRLLQIAEEIRRLA